jgi:hypothetical protein
MEIFILCGLYIFPENTTYRFYLSLNWKGDKMKNITIITSAFKTENDLLTNYKNHRLAINALANFGLKAKEAIGSYDGVQELSLVIDFEKFDSQLLQKVKKLFFNTFKQSSVLLVTPIVAVLVFADENSEELGKLHKVSEDEAKENGAFTYLEGEYYIAKKENLPVWGERQPV